MATLPDNPIVVDLSSSYGAMVIGGYVSCAFWGINSMQTYLYFWNYEKDTVFLKSLVAFCWLVDTLHQVFVLKTTWHTLVQQFGRISNLYVMPQDALHSVWTEYVVVAVVQVYYIRRIVKFAASGRYHRQWWLWATYLIFGCVFLSQFALLAGFLVYTFNRPMAAVFLPRTVHFATGLVSTSLVMDAAIAACMLFLLQHQGSKLSKTSSMIRRLSVIVVNTGLLTAVFTAITLILDLSFGTQDLWYTIVQFPLCSAYLSGFLANLNARHYVTGEGGIVTFTNMEDIRITHVGGPAEVSKPIHFTNPSDRSDSTVDLGTGPAPMVISAQKIRRIMGRDASMGAASSFEAEDKEKPEAV